MSMGRGLVTLPSQAGRLRASLAVPLHCSHSAHIAPLIRHGGRPARCARALATPDSSSSKTVLTSPPTSATDAVERGLKAFKETRDYEEAVRLFNAAMKLSPNDDEARAALYNLGCALTRLKRWTEAAAAIVRAINDYKLKLSVALADPDLQSLRDRREWLDALTEAKGGMSRATKIELRSEAKSPFRVTRLFLFSSLSAGAGLGLAIIATRLAAALKGGEGAPDLSETVTNFAVNSVVLAVLAFLLRRDLQARDRAKQVADREELLSRLQVDLGKDRQLPLLKLRGQVRPIIVAGSKEYVERSMRASDKHQRFLRERGISVVPIVFGSDVAVTDAGDPSERIRALKREMMAQAAPTLGQGFAKRAVPTPAPAPEEVPVSSSSSSSSSSPFLESDKKWRLMPHGVAEWREWVQTQAELVKLPAGQAIECYIQVQLDGTVRASGLGVPPWAKLVEDLPELDSARTRFGDGIGTDV